MNNREKKLLTGIVLVGVGLAVLAATYPQQTRQVADALKKKREQPKPEPVVTEDIDYVEVVDVESVSEEPCFQTEPPAKNKKWYTSLMFWRWNIWKRVKSS